jgi:hypothetical protein
MLHYVRQFDYVSGDTQERDLNQVPAKNGSGGIPLYITGILLKFYISETAAATSDAIAQGMWCTLLNSLEFVDNTGRKFLTNNPLGGRFWRANLKYLRREGYNDPAALGADSDAVNTRVLNIYIPLALPTALQDDELHIQPASRLRGGTCTLGWAANTAYGTGHTIGATTYCQMFVDVVERNQYEARADLLYSSVSPDLFDQYRLSVNGRLLSLFMFRPDGGGVFAANDFTHVDIRGDTIFQNRQIIDSYSHFYNAAMVNDGDGGDAYQLLPTSGAAEDFPVYMAPTNAKISRVPAETTPIITLIDGAGAPAVSDQKWGLAISKPVNLALSAESFGLSDQVPLTQEQVIRAFRADSNSEGLKGGLVKKSNPAWPWLPKPVNLIAAGTRNK